MLQIDVPVCSLGLFFFFFLPAQTLSECVSSIQLRQFYRSACRLTLKQQIMDIYLESVFYVELCGLNLIITKATMHSFDPPTAPRSLPAQYCCFSSTCRMGTSVLCFIFWLFRIFSSTILSGFPKVSSPACIGALLNPGP